MMEDEGKICYNETNPEPKILYGCETKVPNKQIDCFPSDDNKKDGYDYWCYEVSNGEKECSLFTKEEYKIEKALL